MPTPKTEKTGRTWRRDAPGGARAPVIQPQWRRPAKTQRRHPLGRSLRIGAVWCAFLLLFGLVFWMALWLRLPRHARMVLIGAGYEDNLAVPHNVYGRMGLETLADQIENGHAPTFWGHQLLSLNPKPRLRILRTAAAWDRDIGDFPEKTLVVFFALHGGADLPPRSDHVDPYLIPNDAEPTADERNRLRIAQILERLAALPANKNKVLILDATQVRTLPTFGSLHNEFARGLRALAPRIEQIPNLVVLCASDINQQSNLAEEWRTTIFTHAIREGLRGGANDANNDGRISVYELYQYSSASVQDWVRRNRADLQTPFLLPEGSEGQARAQRADLILASNYVPSEPPKHEGVDAAAQLLENAWSRYQQLARERPTLADDAPCQWRQYRDLLIRHTQLVRAGGAALATVCKPRLDELEKTLRAAGTVELASVQNTLAMPVVAGVPPTDSTALGRPFQELWQAPSAEWEQRWNDILAKVTDPAAKRLLPLRLSELIFERAGDDPASFLDKSYALLRRIGTLDDPLHPDRLNPRPAELHYLAMLRRDRPAVPKTASEFYEVVQRALRVRSLAERAAVAQRPDGPAYSERVFRWTMPLLEPADALRRRGQDELLSADPADWKKARADLQEAERGFQAALAAAGIVQTAIRAEHEVLATLPYDAAWFAQRTLPDFAVEVREENELLKEFEQLWEQTHRLTDLLEARGASVETQAGKPASVNDLIQPTERVRGRFAALHQRIVGFCEAIAKSSTAADWQEMEAALTIPTTESTYWKTLLRKQPTIPMERFAPLAPGTGGDGIAAKELAERAYRRARRQGLLTLAELGRAWFDRFNTADEAERETYGDVRHRIEHFAVEEDGWKSLAAAGEAIGQRWAKIPSELERIGAALGSQRATAPADEWVLPDLRPSVAELAPASDPATKTPALGPVLRYADWLTRRIDGGLGKDVAWNPAARLRNFQLRELLLWQAERTLADHWSAEQPAAPPYYRAAGQVYLTDARRLTVEIEGEQRLKQSAFVRRLLDVERRLNQPDDLAFAGPAQVEMTSEPAISLRFELQPQAGAAPPEGLPIAWVETGKGLEPVDLLSARRRLLHVGQAQEQARLVAAFQSPILMAAEKQPPKTPQTITTQVVVRGLYRGQPIERITAVGLHPLPQTQVVQLPVRSPPKVAVRTDKSIQQLYGSSRGAVALVLDCSGSMGPADGQAFTADTKYAEAVRALREVLQQIPRGTTVSLWVFGQAVGPAKTVEQPERYVTPVLDPTPWDPNDPDLLQQLMARIEYPTIEPWNQSPIVRSLVAARDDVIQSQGFKTIVAITDGMDNRFQADRALNPDQKDIPSFLRETFKDSGISVNIIGFKAGEEEAAARKQFQVIEELPTPGHYYTVNETRELAATLALALRQRLHYGVETEENLPVLSRFERGLDMGEPGGSDQWFPGVLAPGGYKVWAQADRRVEATIALGRGDRLLLNLTARPRGIGFERLLLSDEPAFANKPSREKAGWRLTLLTDQRVGDAGLNLLTTFEKTPAPDETILEQLRPRMIWYEIAPAATGTQPFHATWGFRANYASPVWQFQVPQWPVGAGGTPVRPVVRVWWNAGQELVPAVTFQRGTDFDSVRNLASRTLLVDGDEIRLDGVTVEDRLVETEPGLRAVRPCLVVRITHRRDKPVWADLQGIKIDGAEHRFYDQAGCYTGIFWLVSRERADEAITGLALYSVPAFKRDAQQRGLSLELTDTPVPQPDDIVPAPVP